MKAHVSQREIAERLGVSQPTVSLALRNSAEVSPALRRKVQNLARRLGYRPDPVMAGAAASKWKNRNRETVVFLYPPGWRWAHSAFEGAAHAAEELGCHMDAVEVAPQQQDAIPHILYSRGIRGVLLHVSLGIDFLAAFPVDRFATVLIGSSTGGLPADVVECNRQHGMRFTWQHVVERGYRRIGVVLFLHKDNTRDFGLHATALEMQDLSRRQLQPIPILNLPTDRKDWQGDFDAWYEAHRPDAVIGLTTVFYWQLRTRVRVPEDCAFAALRLPPKDEHGAIAGMDQRDFDTGYHAMGMLHTKLQANRIGDTSNPLHVLLAPSWINGQSLPDHDA